MRFLDTLRNLAWHVVFMITFGLLMVYTSPALAQYDDDSQKVETSLISTQDALVPGEIFTLLIEQKIIPHWHTYWTNPGDSGTPPKFDIQLPDGFEQIGETLAPSPHRIPYGPLMNFGHEGTIYYQAEFKAPDNLTIGEDINIGLSAEWLVCQDICIPEYAKDTLTLSVQENATLINKGKLNAAVKGRPANQGWPSQSTHFYTSDSDIFTIQLNDTPDNIALEDSNIAFFPNEWGVIRNDVAQTLTLNEKEKTAILKIARDTRDLSEFDSISGVIKIGDQYNHVSLMPAEAFITTKQDNNNAQTTLGVALLLAFLGGLILNLMPCVFPVLSMKALSLVKLQEKERGHSIKHGFSYTLGVLLSFAAIAGLLIILQNTGAQIGWGFQLQNPIITGFFAYLLFIIGLNLSGFFDIGGGFAGMGGKLTRGNDTKSSFFTGILATLVATPCTAPFMATALGYALVQPPLIAMAVFLMLGFGLAFPYLLLTIVPQFQKSLPKPGLWMETFRQFLSFPMFLSAIWLAWVFAQQTSVMAFASLILGVIAISFGIWLIKNFPKNKSILQLVVIFMILASFLWAAFIPLSKTLVVDDMGKGRMSEQAQEKALFEPYTPEKLEQALTSDKAIFVNMTADWCITCKVNERLALSSNSFKQALKDHDILYLKGDWTNQDSDITKFLKSYGRNGVPLYVFYQAPDQNGERAEPHILPQILTEGTVLDAFNKGNEH